MRRRTAELTTAAVCLGAAAYVGREKIYSGINIYVEKYPSMYRYTRKLMPDAHNVSLLKRLPEPARSAIRKSYISDPQLLLHGGEFKALFPGPKCTNKIEVHSGDGMLFTECVTGTCHAGDRRVSIDRVRDWYISDGPVGEFASDTRTVKWPDSNAHAHIGDSPWCMTLPINVLDHSLISVRRQDVYMLVRGEYIFT